MSLLSDISDIIDNEEAGPGNSVRCAVKILALKVEGWVFSPEDVRNHVAGIFIARPATLKEVIDGKARRKKANAI